MKKILLVFCTIFVSFFATQVSAESEQIDNYEVEIEIRSDSSLFIKESIDYNFGDQQKHGIYRNIPHLAKDLSEIRFKIKDVVVQDELGNSYNTNVSKSFSNTSIKIGDADKYVTGLKKYIISYEVEGAFKFEENSDNLF